MSIGDNIKKWREHRNLKQSELAEMLGVSDKTVSSWEINRTEPKMGMVEKISSALHCKKTDIIGIDDVSDEPYYLNEETREIAQEVFENPEFFDLVENYRAIPNDMQRRLIAYATKLRQLHNAEELLNAAHERTDISDAERTQEAKKAEEDIMDDPNF